MKLTILGSGTFFVNKTISASSFVLEIGSKRILVDCGPGTLAKLGAAGYTPADLDYVFITHFHADHSSDLFSLFMNYRLKDMFEPGSNVIYPTFCGPDGMDQFLFDYSRLVELHAYEGWENRTVLDYQPIMDFHEFSVKTYKVVHEAFKFPARAYSLRFEAEGKVIAFSGDTALCPGVEEACKDADLFVCDTSFDKKIVGNVHINTLQIGELAQKQGVKKLLLDHFYPQYNTDTLVEEIRENYSRELVKAKDLEVIEL